MPEIKIVVCFVEQEPLFELGELYITAGAKQALRGLNIDPARLIVRHVLGDWAELPKSDQAENKRAVKHSGRIFSAYSLPDNTKIWVITECDRSCTTILLPEEY